MPLYNVTCGDIGTKPEVVESYLETVLMPGKTGIVVGSDLRCIESSRG